MADATPQQQEAKKPAVRVRERSISEEGINRVQRTYERVRTLKEGEEPSKDLGAVVLEANDSTKDHDWKIVEEKVGANVPVFNAEDRLKHTNQ